MRQNTSRTAGRKLPLIAQWFGRRNHTVGRVRRPPLLSEQLELRALMASDLQLASAYHNPYLAADVNADGHVTSVDVLTILDDLHINGPRSITTVNRSILGPTPISSVSENGFLDVNNDGLVTYADAHAAVAALESTFPPPDANDRVEIKVEAIDASGALLTQINVGQTFFLRGTAQDLRTGAGTRGVFSAYFDIAYDSTRATVNGPVQFSSSFNSNKAQNTVTPGLIDETGAFSTTAQGTAITEVFRVPMIANKGGSFVFSPNPAEDPQGLDNRIALFNDNSQATNLDFVAFTGGALTINGDPPVTVSIGNVSFAEGNTGSTIAQFPVTLSAKSSSDVTVNISTQDLSAKAGEDYTAINNQLVTIPAGQLSVNVPVTVVGDTFAEPDESIQLRLSSPTNATIADQKGSALLTITNDDGEAPTLSLRSDVRVFESAGATGAEIFADLSAASTRDVTFAVKLTDQGTNGASDYGSVALITIPAGVTSKSFTLPLVDDTIAEATEKLQVSLVDVGNAKAGGSPIVVTIFDNDQPIQVVVGDTNVSEDEGNAARQLKIPVTLSKASTETVSFRVSTKAISATAGQDFVALEDQLITFAPGVTSQDINVTIQGDTTIEADESFRLEFTDVTNASLSRLSRTVTLKNDDLPNVSITGGKISEGNDGVRQLSFVISLSEAISKSVTVSVSDTLQGAALSGTDYTAFTTQQVVIPANQTSASVSVEVKGDVETEADETVELQLSAATNANILTAKATGTILNDDALGPPTISIGPAVVSTVEGNTGTTKALFTLTLSRAISEAVTVKVNTSGGDATAGQDYVAITDQVITFAANETSKTVEVTINGETTPEIDESFNVVLSSPTGGVLASVASAKGVITDDDRPLVSVGPVSVQEGNDGTKELVFVVSLATPASEAISFGYTTEDITAKAGQGDYVAKTGQVQFNVGDTEQKIAITVNGDTLDEADETFRLKLGASTQVRFTNDSAVGTIVDDDVPTVSFENGTLSVTEANEGTTAKTLRVRLSSPAIEAVTVGYKTVTGTANSDDFVQIESGSLTFGVGEQEKEITISIKGDKSIESDEQFSVQLVSPQKATLGVNGSQTVTIVNDDLPTISLSDASVAEGNSGTTNLGFKLELSEAAPFDVKVKVAPLNTGTAASGVDFKAFTQQEVTIPANQKSVTFNVEAIGDTTTEADETIVLSLSDPTNAVIGKATATGVIINDDGPLLPTISIAAASVQEGNTGETDLVFTISLSAAATSAVSVRVDTLTATGDTATSDVDYSSQFNQTVNFAVGDTSKTFTVKIVNDTIREANETFTVALSNPVGAVLSTTAAAAIGTINDNDPSPTITISNSTGVEVDPGASSNVPFVVRLSNASSTPVTVNFATSDGTAVAGQDYTSTTTVVTFEPGQTQRSIAVPIIPDDISESSKTFTVTLSNASNGVLGTATAIGTINDDDGILPTVSIADASVIEGPLGTTSQLKFMISLSQASLSDVSFFVVPQDLTANGANSASETKHFDYLTPTASEGAVTIPAGQTQREFIINVRGDNLVEPDEIVRVFLTTLSTNVTAGDIQADGKIVNDDEASTGDLTLYVTDASIVEGDPSVGGGGGDTSSSMVFTVTLSKASSTPVTVRYNTADGASSETNAIGSASGNSQADYVSSAQGDARPTITFAPGELRKTFSVPIRGEGLYERDETFFVDLSDVQGAALGRAFARGTIQNNDPPPTISVSNIVVQERPGTENGLARVVVTRNGSTALPLSFRYRLTGNTATAGTSGANGDFRANNRSSEVTIPANTNTTEFNVTVFPDNVTESDETLFLDLIEPVDATIGAGRSIITIQDQNLTPASKILYTLRAVNAQGQIINSVNANETFSLQIFAQDVRASSKGVISAFSTVNYNSNLVEIVDPNDIVFGASFPENRNATTSTPGVIANIGGSNLGSPSIGPGPNVQLVADIPMRAKASGTANFTISLPDTNSNIQFSNFLPLEQGEQALTVVEGTEVLLRGTTLSVGNPPVVRAQAANVVEGDTGTKDMVFNVTLSAAQANPFTINYVASIGSAVAGVDYTLDSSSLTIPAGQTTGQVIVKVIGDTIREPSEGVILRFTPADTTIPSFEATGVIEDNDPVPSVTIADAKVVEGNGGDRNLAFTVSLSGPSAELVTVNYSTADSTGANAATAGTDYRARNNQTITFSPNETQKIINISVIGDEIFESDETFRVVLSLPASNANAKLGDKSEAIGTITNDDADANQPVSVSGLMFIDANNNGVREPNEQFLSNIGVTVRGVSNTGATVPLRSARTDQNGAYSFTNLPPGEYTITQDKTPVYVNGSAISGTGATSFTALSADSYSIKIDAAGNAASFNFTELGLSPAFINKRWAANTTTTEVVNQWIQQSTNSANRIAAVSSLARASSASLMSELSQRAGAGDAAPTTRAATVSLANKVVTVQGTAGDDSFQFNAGANLSFTVNGASYSYDRASVEQIVFRGGGGNDAATMNGSDENEQAEITAKGGVFAGLGYTVQAIDVSTLLVFGGGGQDTAVARDSGYDDHLEATGNRLAISSPGMYSSAVVGFEVVKAISSRGGRDTRTLQALDFALESFGPWIDE